MNFEEAVLTLEESLWLSPPLQTSSVTILNKRHKEFIASMAVKIHSNQKLSTKQAAFILRLILTYGKIIADKKNIGIEEVRRFVKSPVYVNEPYESLNIPNEVRYIGDDFLVFKFKFQPIIKEDIKNLKPEYSYPSPYPMYNVKQKIWIVKVSVHNIENIMNVIRKHGFEFEEDLAQYFTDVLNRKTQKPAVHVENNKIIIDIPNDEIFSNYVDFLLVNLENNNAQ